MSKFWMTVEDPMYDEDGILVDEDAQWEDLEVPDEAYDPYDTVNS
jgi:hypothetical protein